MDKLTTFTQVTREIEDLKLRYSKECEKLLERFQKELIRLGERYKKEADKIIWKRISKKERKG